MKAAFDPVDLKPPRPGRWSMPMVLAVAAHLVLIAALTWGVRWQQDTQPETFDAELWSAVPQQAAPREVKPPPPPPRAEPKPEPKVEPKVEPKPEPKAEPKEPDTREADIAIAQAKKKKLEAEKREADKKAAQEKAAKEKADKAERDKKAKEAALEKQKKADAVAKQKALDDKIKQLNAEKQKAETQRANEASAKAREDQMRRIMGQAGATGDAGATGSAEKSSGPSAGYAGRVRARIKPNVLLTEDIAGNPKAEVDITTAADGTIISRRLSRSSGVAAWDRAALAAIDRTGTLPRDVDGRVPSPMTIVLSPRE